MLSMLLMTIIHTQDFNWPIKGDITSEFGPRWGRMHDGIDISADKGKWVRSSADGLVIFVGKYGNYGNLVVVKHANKIKTFYAHLKNFCVFKYQKVKQGQKLGRVGMTGRTTGPHLHFEVKLTNNAIDPLLVLNRSTTIIDRNSVAVGGP